MSILGGISSWLLQAIQASSVFGGMVGGKRKRGSRIEKFVQIQEGTPLQGCSQAPHCQQDSQNEPKGKPESSIRSNPMCREKIDVPTKALAVITSCRSMEQLLVASRFLDAGIRQGHIDLNDRNRLERALRNHYAVIRRRENEGAVMPIVKCSICGSELVIASHPEDDL
jgi:hypothetical protein